MKLSEVKGERVFDVMAELVDPIANIATSDVIKKAFDGSEDSDGEYSTINRLRKSAPEIIKKHKNDVVRVLSSIAGVSPEEYEDNMTLMSLWTDVMELLGDDDFLAFLGSTQTMMQGLQST